MAQDAFQNDGSQTPKDAALGFTNEERVRQILIGVFKQMEEDKAEAGSYYNLVPKVLQPFVDALIEKHYPDYAEQFDNNKATFKEKMSQNWVAKFRAFPQLAQAAGFIDLSNTREIPAQFISDSMVTCLTVSSSYVLIGPNSLNKQGAGAYLDYVRLPLREEATIRNINISEGAYLESVPRIAERLHITGIHDLRTSPIIAIWEKPVIDPTYIS